MVEAFDRIVVSVPDLGEALPEYSLLLGATGQRMGSAPARAWLGLSNTVVELVEHPLRETWRLHFHSRMEHLIGLED